MRSLERAEGTTRIILFLGSNIGNFDDDQLEDFLSRLSEITSRNDKLLIGFDLMKSPGIIMQAYDDPHGLTREFNINHLRRINREMGADFDTRSFEHEQVYDEITGEMKSYLLSCKDQIVMIEDPPTQISFFKGERIFMELSRKFSIIGINELAPYYGFRVINNFTDRRNYFIDSLWIKE